MEKDKNKFEYKLIENTNINKETPAVRTSKLHSNPMMEKFLEFRLAKKFAPKDLI